MSSESAGTITGQVFSYDTMGRVLSNWQCTPRTCGGTPYLLGYGYDLAGDLTSAGNGAGVTFGYAYNAAARVTGMTSNLVDSQHPATLLSTVHYNQFGPVSDALGNGLNETVGYSARGIPQSYSATPYSFSLGLAANGAITSGNDSVNGNWTYGYDPFNRLVTSNKNSGAQTFSYVYDRYGNRLQQNAPQGGPAPQYLFDNNNRISGSGVTYDALGNIQTDGLGNAFTYDAESRLIKVVNSGGTYNYTYDADGRRIKNGSSEFLYDLAGRAVTLFGATNGVWNYGEIYAGGRHLATYSGATTNFLHTDWLGTKRVMSNLSGANSQTCTSLPFGDGSSCIGTEWGFNHFTDDIHDSESNLEHTLFRQSSTTQGRWMSPDPYLGSLEIGNPQSLNRYVYVLNNPMNLVDPNGLENKGMGWCLLNEEDDDLVPCLKTTANGNNGGGGSSLNLCDLPGICSPGGGPGGGGGGSGGGNTGGAPSGPAPNTCVAPNFLQRAGIAAQRWIAQQLGVNAFGFGLGGSASGGAVAGYTFSVSRQVFVTPNGDAAFVTTITDPRFLAVPINSVVTPGASAYGGFQFSSSDVRDLKELEGPGMDFGFGGGGGVGGGMDYSVSTDPNGVSEGNVSTLTVGAGAGGAGKGLAPTFTFVIRICR